MRFYGREEEIKALQHFLEIVISSHSSQLVNVLGRRRVGKTTLIAKAFENCSHPVLSFVIQERSEEATAAAWLDALIQTYKPEFIPNCKSIVDVLSFAMTLSKEKPCIFIIDECQELNKVSPGFWSQLQAIWDRKKDTSQMLLVMSGSIISAMEQIFGDHSQPMYGRSSCRIEVMPFTPSVLKQIMLEEVGKFDPKDLLTVYAITGGVAAYVELLSKQQALSASKAIRFLFSIEGGWLRAEGNVYLANEFQRKFSVYKDILHAIASGDTKWNKIQDRIPENISSYLRRLEEFRLIDRQYPILDEASPRKSRYRIADPYLRFWLTFVDTIRMTDLAAYHHWDKLVELCEEGLPSFLGKTLERWFISSYLESGQWSPVGSWWDNKGLHEIDLIAVDETNKQIVFGEAKLNPEKYDKKKLEQSSQAFLSQHKKYADYSKKLVGLFPENM